MLTIQGLVKRYRLSPHPVLAGIDLKIPKGCVMGLLGRSGSGKSTLARILLGLEEFEAGTVKFDGSPFVPRSRAMCRQIQLMWQDPLAAMSPFQSVYQSIAEPIAWRRSIPSGQRESELAAMLDFVGLTAERARRYPFELSGGECQRAVLARALVAKPKILVLDEPLSSLDPVAQTELVSLLRIAIRDQDMSVLLISHDVPIVGQLADQIAFLHQGRIVETAETSAFLKSPACSASYQYLKAVRTFGPISPPLT